MKILDVPESSGSLFSHNRIYFPGRFHESSANLGSDFLYFRKEQFFVDFGVFVEILAIQNPRYLENEEYCFRQNLICFSSVSEDEFSTIK